jgi:hypothetical protein
VVSVSNSVRHSFVKNQIAIGLIGVFVGLPLVGCKAHDKTSATSQADSWPELIHVTVRSAKQVFADNWVIHLEIKNESDDIFVLSELTESQAYITFSDGTRRPIHEKSVGKSKKTVVPLNGVKEVQLLFGAAKLRPSEVVLKGKRFAIGKS